MGAKRSLPTSGGGRFDRSVDQKAREWAEAYVHFASGQKRSWLRSLGVGFFPLCSGLNAAATGRRATAIPCPGSTSRDTGPALVEPFLAKVLEGVDTGRVGLHFRHRALSLTTTADRSPAFPATFCNRRRRSGDNIRPRRHREL